MNNRHILFNILAIVASLTMLIPLFNFVTTVMNLESDLAYFGPVIAFLGAFIVGSIVTSLAEQSLSIKSYNQLKSTNKWDEQKATGNSSKKNVNKKNKINN